MKEYNSLKIKKKFRFDQKKVKFLLYRVLPIVLVLVLSICSFKIFEKKISEIVANQKYTALAERGDIDDPISSDYNVSSIDWLSAYSSEDPNGFDPLALSPLSMVENIRPSSSLASNTFEVLLGYTNKQSKIWSIHDSINSDISAWIYINGLGINYPVAAESSGAREYYLTHSYDRTASTSGTLYFPIDCEINPISKNLIIFGHNMRDNTMFATLKNYLNGTQSFFNSHKYIFFDTLYGTYRYEIFSVYKTVPEDAYLRTSFSSNADFTGWCDQINTKSVFVNDSLTLSATDRILTLSTCDDTGKFRIIVHAKMVYPVPTVDIDNEYISSKTDDNSIDSTVNEETSSSATTSTVKENFEVGSAYRLNLSDHTSNMRLRSGPSTSKSVVGSLAHGTQMTILENTSDEWVKVKTAGGMEGYLLKKYLISENQFAYVASSDTVGAP